MVNVIEGAIFGKRAVGSLRLQYLKQFTRNTRADINKAMKIMACNKSRREAANQSRE